MLLSSVFDPSRIREGFFSNSVETKFRADLTSGEERRADISHIFSIASLRNFKKTGISKVQRLGRQSSKTIAEANQLVSEGIQKDSTLSIAQVVRNLDFSNSYCTIQLKIKPYKFNKCQELIETHKNPGLSFCSRTSDSNIIPKNSRTRRGSCQGNILII